MNLILQPTVYIVMLYTYRTSPWLGSNKAIRIHIEEQIHERNARSLWTKCHSLFYTHYVTFASYAIKPLCGDVTDGCVDLCFVKALTPSISDSLRRLQ